MAENNFDLYRKDKTNYSFIIVPALNELQKVKLTALKRDSNNKRIDMALFYEDYRTFKAVLSILEQALKAKADYHLTHFGGTDGKRKIVYSVKNGKVTFGFNDKIIQSKIKGCEKYSGEMLFSIEDRIDLLELFDIKTTINNWEITAIQKLLTREKENDS